MHVGRLATVSYNHDHYPSPSSKKALSAVLVARSPLPTMNRQSSAAMSAHQRLEAATDLSQLSSISDDIIVACLRERFMTDTIYTNIGTSSLVALNPHKYVSSNADSILHKYAAEYRDSSDHQERLPPHIFQTANNAYYHMKRTTQDQCLVFRFVFTALTFTLLTTTTPAGRQAVASRKIVDWRSSPSSSSA